MARAYSMTKHDGASSRYPAEYNAWRKMLFRCINPKSPSWKHYGGRGISVCRKWTKNFWSFFHDLGPKPFPGAILDRIDNDGNYVPGNVRWTTAKRSATNRRTTRFLTWQGKTHSITRWARILGIYPGRIHQRLQLGWSVEDTLSIPPGNYRKRLMCNGITLSIANWSKRVGISAKRIRARLQQGWSVEDALFKPLKAQHL